MYTYSFEKLEVWCETKELTKSIYRLTSTFPDEEKYGLISQIRRASVSIGSNIAEGSARNTFKDKAHFTNMAYTSTLEVLNQLIIAFELEYFSESLYIEIRLKIESVTNKLNSLRNYQITKSTTTK